MIGAYHPHTVRAHPIPLYMRGFPAWHHLGQDDGSDPSADFVFSSDGNTMTDTVTGYTTDMTTGMVYDANGAYVGGGSGMPTIDTTSAQVSNDLILPSTPQPMPSTPAIPTNLQPSLSPAQLSQLYQSAVAAGSMTQSQANAAIAAATGAAKGLITAPSPRVTVPTPGTTPGAAPSLLTSSSIIKGVPDIALIGGALLAFVALGNR